MRKLLLYLTLISGVFGTLLTGCEDGDIIDIVETNAVVNISVTGINRTEAVVKITPNQETASFIFAIGQESDRNSFLSATYAGIIKEEGNEEIIYTFTELDPGQGYTVFAAGYDAAGTMSGVQTDLFTTPDKWGDVSADFVSGNAAAIRVCISDDYHYYSYALGTAADKEGFLNGTLAGMAQQREVSLYVYTYLNLEPGTDYVFYCNAYNRANETSEFTELPFTTLNPDDCAGIISTQADIDILAGKYTFTANDNTGKIIALIGERGMYSGNAANPNIWYGNMAGMIKDWDDVELPYVTSSAGTTLETLYSTYSMSFDVELEAYVVTLDKSGNIANLQYFDDYRTPSYDPSAGTARVEIEISGIGYTGATYTYTPNENTIGFYCNTIDADWLDNELLSQTDPYYIHDLIVWDFYTVLQSTKSTLMPFTEETCEPGKRYYAVALPFNANGTAIGWGEVVLKEFHTSSY